MAGDFLEQRRRAVVAALRDVAADPVEPLVPQRVSGAAESLDERLDRLTADVVRVLDRLDVIEALVRGSHDSPAAVGDDDDDERPLPTTPRVPPLSIAGEMSGPASNALFGE